MAQAVAEESVDRIPAFLAERFAEAEARLSAAEVVETNDGEA